MSSTRIRLAIASGQMEEAAQLLGRPYQLSNPVQPGARLGRKLGFPTANLYPPSDKVIPPDGVYACWAGVGRFSPAVASIGLRPTLVIGGERLIEVHLLDSSHRPRLTGRKLRVALVARLREERRFGSKEALARQIAEDCWQARSLLAALQPPVDML